MHFLRIDVLQMKSLCKDSLFNVGHELSVTLLHFIVRVHLTNADLQELFHRKSSLGFARIPKKSITLYLYTQFGKTNATFHV